MNINRLKRLDFIDVAPQAIENKLSASRTANDLVVQNLELAAQTEPVNLN